MDRPRTSVSTRAGKMHLCCAKAGSQGPDSFRRRSPRLAPGGSVHAEGSELVIGRCRLSNNPDRGSYDSKADLRGGDPEAHASARWRRRGPAARSGFSPGKRPYISRCSQHGASSWSAPTANEDLLRTRESAFSDGADDLGLQELYFQFARYLLISSSRPEDYPRIYRESGRGRHNPWGSKWTININTEMNYWLAEPAGLGKPCCP